MAISLCNVEGCAAGVSAPGNSMRLCGSLVPVVEVVSGLDGPVKALRKRGNLPVATSNTTKRTGYSVYNEAAKSRAKANTLAELYPPLPSSKFDIIYADPPWHYNGKMQFDKSSIAKEKIDLSKNRLNSRHEHFSSGTASRLQPHWPERTRQHSIIGLVHKCGQRRICRPVRQLARSNPKILAGFHRRTGTPPKRQCDAIGGRDKDVRRPLQGVYRGGG